MPIDYTKLVNLEDAKAGMNTEHAMIASNYSSSATYAVGAYAYYAGTLYKCTTAITTAEAWNSAHWTEAKLGNDLVSQSEKIDEVQTEIADNTTGVGLFEVGAYDVQSGATTSNNARIRTKSRVQNVSEAYIDGDYSFLVIAYNKTNGDYVGTLKTTGEFEHNYENLAWVTKFIAVPENGYYYNFVIRKTSSPSTEITTDVANNFHISTLRFQPIASYQINSDIIESLVGGLNAAGYFYATPGLQSIRFKCSPNTTYVIDKKIVTSRFIVGLFNVKPINGEIATYIVRDDTATSLTITTNEDSEYISAMIWVESLDSGINYPSLFNNLSVKALGSIDPLTASNVEKLSEKTSATRIFGKKISIIGDSISTYDDPRFSLPNYNPYYPNHDVQNVNETWWKTVANMSGATIEVNTSYGGSRVTEREGYPDFYDRCSLLGSPDTIFVVLGANDSTGEVTLGEYDFETSYTDLSESTFRTAYIKGIKCLKATYPNARIYCIALKMGDDYFLSIKTIAKTLECRFVDARDYIGYNGIHPAYYGMKQIAYKVANGFGEDSNVPDAPTTDGTYTLKVTVSSGMPTLSWVADT